MCNRNLQLKVGLNIDTIPFSKEGDCVEGEIYYCDAKDALQWINIGYMNLCTVEIPNDAQTVKFKDKYRSDKIIICDTPVFFDEHKMWNDTDICKQMVKNDGQVLSFIKNQTDEICKLAVR
uniref:Uncharacterized protein n=1 Tax=viral metagenome TaxID=1070528 RepID=A0A6C0J5N3_9ZZZZ